MIIERLSNYLEDPLLRSLFDTLSLLWKHLTRVLELDLNQNHYLMATSSESYEVSRITKTSPFRSEGTRTRRPNKKKGTCQCCWTWLKAIQSSLSSEVLDSRESSILIQFFLNLIKELAPTPTNCIWEAEEERLLLAPTIFVAPHDGVKEAYFGLSLKATGWTFVLLYLFEELSFLLFYQTCWLKSKGIYTSSLNWGFGFASF